MAGELALGALYTEHRAWLHEWFRRRTTCTDQAKDLVQDAFLKLIQSASSAPMENPRALLTLVAKQILIDKYRRQALETAYLGMLANLPEQVYPSEEDRVIVCELLRRLDRILLALPESVRAAFLLVKLDGLSYPEVAQQLGVSERTVSRYMVQAYEACLMAKIQEYGTV